MAVEHTREPIEALAEEFLERRRQGERVSAKDYAEAHPELAEEILDLFPTMLALEKLGDDTPGDSSTPSANFDHPERLGDLRLLREIGRGGMGIVYEAEQESLGRRVAVKILPERALFDTKRLERFRREARTAAALQHPHIVPIYGVGEQEGLHYLSMQLIEGAGLDVVAKIVGEQAGVSSGSIDEVSGSLGSDSSLSGSGASFAAGLAQALVANDFDSTLSGSATMSDLPGPALKPSPGAATDTGGDAATIAFSSANLQQAMGEASLVLNTSVANSDTMTASIGPDYFRGVAKIGIQTAEALAYAHARGTMHRDIKPANLLLDRRGSVWITDFGLAKAIDPLADDGVSRSGEMVGTLRYMAPEQLRGESDSRSDLYSLGLTLYELATWRPAFKAAAPSELIRKITSEAPAPPRRVNPQTPRDLETVILKAIARDPADRYQTGDDLAADLRRFSEAIPVAAQRESFIRGTRSWLRRNPLVAGLAAAVVLLGGTTLLAVTTLLTGPPPPPEFPPAPAVGIAGSREDAPAGQAPPLDEASQLADPRRPKNWKQRPPRREGYGPFGPDFEPGLPQPGPGRRGPKPPGEDRPRRRPLRDDRQRGFGPPPRPLDEGFPPHRQGFAPHDPLGLGPAGQPPSGPPPGDRLEEP